ncbi:MAG: TonB-dependent receptor [Chloroherpetonaceae bacterium]|nr:TonB-dependent receptor [Chloroherpetonaceae bacterium]
MSHTALAQTVTLSGYVRDAKTGEELVGATVQLKEIARGTATNANGYYAITAEPGTYTVIVRSIGYQELRQTLTLRSNLTKNFLLEPAELQAEEVTVSAERPSTNVTSTEMGATKFNAETAKRVPVVLGETDILKTLQLLPGVSAPEGTTGYSVRGGSTDQNLILLNEATIYNAAHLLGFFSVFNSDAIEDFKLYKAAIPANYGGRLSSVLDVHQRRGNPSELSLNGGIGLLSSRLLFEGPIVKERGSFLLAGRRSYADLFLNLSRDFRGTVLYFYDLNLKASYTFSENDRLSFSGYLGRDDFGLPEIFGTGYGNLALSLHWNHLLSRSFFSSFTAVYSSYDNILRILSPGAEFQLISGIITPTFKADFTYLISDDHQIDFGIEAVYYQFIPGRLEPLRDSPIRPSVLDEKYAFEPSFYIRHEFPLTKELSLNYGARFNFFYRFGPEPIREYVDGKPLVFSRITGRYENGRVARTTNFSRGQLISSFFGIEPRIALRWLIDELTSFKASYNRTRQNLHFVSNTASPTPLNLYTPSGPFFEPQVADQFSIGLFKNLFGNDIEISLEAYYKDLRNLIDFVDGANLFGNNNIETEVLPGIGRAYGIELFVRKNTGKLTGWLSYTLSRSERKVDGVDGGPGINRGEWYLSPFDRTHNLNLVGIYKISDAWTVSADFVLQTGIPANFPIAAYEISGAIIRHFPETRNAERLPLYHRLDVSVRWDASAPDARFKSAWVLGLYNIYNHRNAASITFRQSRENRFQGEAIRLAFFGIVPSLSWEFKF